jgi:hypothetical protein
LFVDTTLALLSPLVFIIVVLVVILRTPAPSSHAALFLFPLIAPFVSFITAGAIAISAVPVVIVGPFPVAVAAAANVILKGCSRISGHKRRGRRPRG